MSNFSPAGAGGVLSKFLASQAQNGTAAGNFYSSMKNMGAPTPAGQDVTQQMIGNLSMPGIAPPPPGGVPTMADLAQQNNFGSTIQSPMMGPDVRRRFIPGYGNAGRPRGLLDR